MRQRRQELEKNAAVVLQAKMWVAQEREKFDQANRLVLEETKRKLKIFRSKSEELRKKFFFPMRDSKSGRNSQKRKRVSRNVQGLKAKKRHSEPSMKSLVLVRTTAWNISFSPSQYKMQRLWTNLAFNQETGPTTLMEIRTVDTSPLTKFNPNVHPYELPTANDLHEIGQTEPNVTSTNAAQICTLQNSTHPSFGSKKVKLKAVSLFRNPTSSMVIRWSFEYGLKPLKLWSRHAQLIQLIDYIFLEETWEVKLPKCQGDPFAVASAFCKENRILASRSTTKCTGNTQKNWVFINWIKASNN